MDWTDLRYFLGVARTGGLTRTAADLRVSQSTVSRRIAALEDDLGVRLFARHQTGYTLTDQGRNVLALAEAVEERALDVERGAAGLDASATGVVRLATAEMLATHLLIPALPAFIEQHAGLRLEIVTGTAQVALSRREADLALRLVRPEAGNLTVRRVGAMAHALYGSADYLKRHPAPANDPLEGRAVIVWDEAYANLPAARWMAKAWPNAPVALTVSSLSTHLAAARAGLGLAVLPCFLTSDEPTLIEVLPPPRVLVEDLWLVTHADLAHSARVRTVSDFVARTIASAASALENRYPATG
jgi:DNA-binding transcriptional LysR family regulator